MPYLMIGGIVIYKKPEIALFDCNNNFSLVCRCFVVDVPAVGDIVQVFKEDDDFVGKKYEVLSRLFSTNNECIKRRVYNNVVILTVQEIKNG